MKAYRPEEARQIVECLQSPAVFQNMTADWPALAWTLEHLCVVLGEKNIQFRMGRRHEQKAPQFETQCPYVEGSFKQFVNWTAGHVDPSAGPFSDYPLSQCWAYADYKYIALLFQDKPHMFKDLVWSDFGFPDRDGRHSTLWVGSDGANTPCHLDSYGCNLVLQVQGRKRWHLFPPEDSACLYPTRIPYEESSVFSKVSVQHPDFQKFPAFRQARSHVVTLQPGQVLFVPRHWWHYVESLDPLTVSVNSWIELEVDDEARVEEALTRTVVSALKTTPSHDNHDDWLNPTEEGVASHDENMRSLNLAVQACMEKKRLNHEGPSGLSSSSSSSSSTKPNGSRAAKRDSSGGLKASVAGQGSPYAIPFGPHLVPVTCDADLSQKPKDLPSSGSPSLTPPLPPHAVPKPGGSDAPQRGGAPGSSSQPDCGYTPPHRKAPISTNDVLEVLLHPDVITAVARRLIDRQRELDSG